MDRNERRAAREAKHFTAYGIGHSTDGFRAGGNHLSAGNDEPEPTLAGTASEEERRLAAMFAGDADLPLNLQRALDERRGQR